MIPDLDAAACLAWEAQQEGRNEYMAGDVFARVGVPQSHNIATGNLCNCLRNELKGTPCRVFIECVKAHIEAADCFFHPDVLVTCDPRDRAAPDHVSHPVIVAEVLSGSTAAFDRGNKFAAYHELESLREYVLVDTAARRIELVPRDAQNHRVPCEGEPGETLDLASPGVRLPVDALLEDTGEEAPPPA